MFKSCVSDKQRLLVVLLLGGLAVTALGGLGPPPLNTSGTSSSKGGVQGVVEVLCEKKFQGEMLVSRPAAMYERSSPRGLTFCESNRTTNEGTLTICLPTRMCLCLMRTRAWWTDLARLSQTSKKPHHHQLLPSSHPPRSQPEPPTHPLLKTWVCNLLSKKSSTLRAKT